MKTEYSFIKNFPIVIVVSISHISGCAMTYGIIRKEREPSGYKYRVAPGTAMTNNGDNDTPAQPQTLAMGAARRNPRRGEIPVARFSRPPFDDFLS